MKRTRILVMLLLLGSSATFLSSLIALSLDSINPWKHSPKESTFYQEFSVDADSSITLTNIQGPTLIKTWSLSKVVIEASTSSKEKERDLVNIETKLDNNNLSIQTTQNAKKPKGTLNYQLIIPEQANISVITETGAIKIKKVKGTITLKTEQGDIDIQDAGDSVSAQTHSGNINLSSQTLPQDGRIDLETQFGSIEFACPRGSHANVKAETLKGLVTSEHAITLAPKTVKLNKDTWKKMQQEAEGTLGNGGCSVKLFTRNGTIKITEY